MKEFNTFISVCLAVIIMVTFFGVMELEKRQKQLDDRLNDTQTVKVEEPQRIRGKWIIALFNMRIIPTKTVKTNMFYVKDKVIWYADPITGDELPLPQEAMIIPDDGRDLEQYGVYKIVKPD